MEGWALTHLRDHWHPEQAGLRGQGRTRVTVVALGRVSLWPEKNVPWGDSPTVKVHRIWLLVSLTWTCAIMEKWAHPPPTCESCQHFATGNRSYSGYLLATV